MSIKFYAVDKETGKRWEPDPTDYSLHSYLVMYDGGALAVVRDYGWEGNSVQPLDTSKWKPVIEENLCTGNQ